MSKSVEFYSEQLQKNNNSLPGDGCENIQALRKQAMQLFVQQGWPTHKQEAWKYTRTNLLQQQNFSLSEENVLTIEPSEDYQIQTLTNVLELNKDFLVVNKNASALELLNHGLWQEGLVITIKEKYQAKKPLRIHLKNIAKTQSRFIKLFFILEQAAQISVILDHDEAGFSNVMMQTTLAAQAKLTVLNCINADPESIHFIHHDVRQHAASEYVDAALSLQAQWLRYELTAHLCEQRAHCDLIGLYMGTQHQHLDHRLCVRHEAPHCSSNQFYKGVLNDHAKAVFNGKVVVAKDAQKTHATQKNNNILLSKTSEIDTKPELEIYANDVICSHGATVGALSDDALFYFMSRGLCEQQAKTMLVVAFVNEIVLKLGPFKDEVEKLVEKRLEK